jgi:hypothetical protein
MTLLNNGNKKQFLFDYIYHESCKNHIGILDQFNENNQELKKLVLDSLKTNKFIEIRTIKGLMYFSLTQKAITEFTNLTAKDPEWIPDKTEPNLKLIKSLPKVEKL